MPLYELHNAEGVFRRCDTYGEAYFEASLAADRAGIAVEITHRGNRVGIVCGVPNCTAWHAELCPVLDGKPMK